MSLASTFSRTLTLCYCFDLRLLNSLGTTRISIAGGIALLEHESVSNHLGPPNRWVNLDTSCLVQLLDRGFVARLGPRALPWRRVFDIFDIMLTVAPRFQR